MFKYSSIDLHETAEKFLSWVEFRSFRGYATENNYKSDDDDDDDVNNNVDKALLLCIQRTP